MRPFHTLLHQIRWDPRLDAARFSVRWLERSGRRRDEPLAAFLARSDVPQHRVRAVCCDGAVVWDRDTHVDCLEEVLEAAHVGPLPASVAFWNVLDDDTASLRAGDVAAAVAALGVEIVGLAEVSAPVADAVRARCPASVLYVEGSVGVLLPRGQAWQVHRLPLPGRDGLLAHAPGVTVVVAHLTSDVRGDRSTRRFEQLAALTAALPSSARGGAVVVLLDANTDGPLTDLEPFAGSGFVDAGGDAGPTFDPTRNARARGARRVEPRRLDRVLVRGLAVETARVVEHAEPASDHWPLVVTFERPARDVVPGGPARLFTASSDTSIAILPPASIAADLDALRAQHDEGYPRWPAHIHLAFPFVAEEQLEDACVRLARRLVAVEPFQVRLDGTGTFLHGRGRYTVWARPADIEGSLAATRTCVDAIAPPTEREEWTPHLTLASGRGSPPKIDVEARAFTVNHVVALVKNGDARVPGLVLPLGRASLGEAVEECGLADVDDRWRESVDEVARTLPGTLTLIGSSAVGVRLRGSDVDMAWTPPGDLVDPLSFATTALAGRRIESVHAPRVNAVVLGRSVDILLGGDDAIVAATRMRHATGAQRAALLALRVWAHRRGLTGEDSPRSITFQGLVLDEEIEDAPTTAIARAAWRRLADPHDTEVVSGAAFRGVSPHGVARLRAEARRACALIDGLDDEDAPWRAVLVSRG